MPDISPSIPIVGQPNSTEEAKVVTALTQLVSAVNNVDDAQMANPNNAIWRTVQTWDTGISAGTVAGLYYAALNTSFALSGSASSSGVRQYTASATDSAVAGKTTRYRWAYNYATNSVAPNQAITLDVRAVTSVGGAATGTTLTLGAAVAGPAVTFTPSVAGVVGAASAGVAIADGTYMLGITLGGTTAASSYLCLSVSLQMQHV